MFHIDVILHCVGVVSGGVRVIKILARFQDLGHRHRGGTRGIVRLGSGLGLWFRITIRVKVVDLKKEDLERGCPRGLSST